MNWIQSLSNAIKYIESNLTDEISVDEISNHAYSSNSHFQLIFHLVTGMTVGDYIRNRRLSQAAQDLLKPNSKLIDIAMRYQYDTQESFSKAFRRFHGVPPSKAQQGNIKLFHPLTINVTIRGGFELSFKIINEFHFTDWNTLEEQNGALSAADKYKRLVTWAGEARGQNPVIFDKLTEWILDDSEWMDEKLAENEQILLQGVLARFKEQNANLRAYLKELEPSGVVNDAVFKALDRFDDELSGKPGDKRLTDVINKMLSDFSVMKDKCVREMIAGGKTGPAGVNYVDLFGYVNYLKDCDAGVQWALFMPDVVKRQQNGFQVASFEYKKLPAMRFIGKECIEHDEADMSWELEIMRALDAMTEYKSGFDYDVLFQHHYGKPVDVEHWHGFWGRFVKADTPVPEGFIHFDFVPQRDIDNFVEGPPFFSQFAFAAFSGDMKAMHSNEGYDSDAMYDVTRNIMLGQGVNIPYPDKYWTAEVFLNGCGDWSTAFMFSAEL